QSDHGRQAGPDGQRRLGARLLPQLPEPPRGLSQGVVEHCELGQDRGALCRGKGRHARRVIAVSCEKGGLSAALFVFRFGFPDGSAPTARELARKDQATSKRSRFITLVQAATKSLANLSFESAHP